jgi:hypothetical protein
MEQQKETKLFNVLVIIDDCADCVALNRNGKYWMVYIDVVGMHFYQHSLQPKY